MQRNVHGRGLDLGKLELEVINIKSEIATRQKDLEKALLEDIKKYLKKHDQKWSGKTHKKSTLNNYKKYIHVS